MKMHELEAMIDSVKKMRGDALETLKTKTPVKPGQYPPRPIPSESIEDDDVILHVPYKPADRVVKPKDKEPKDKEPKEPESLKAPKRPVKVVKVDEDPFAAAQLFPGIMKRAQEAAAKVKHSCNCPNCKL